MTNRAWSLGAIAAVAVAIGWSGTATAGRSGDDERDDQTKRPRLLLKVDPTVGLGPVHATVTADLVGGANDYREFYCPTVQWDWGDGTRSESSGDCPPYRPGVSEIVRHFSVQHIFANEGQFRVTFRLTRQEKELVSARANVSIR
jgi:hypothetical protein